MKRDIMLQVFEENLDKEWDIVVIGGGATGLGVAVDAVSRGYKTLLLEQSDFAKGTSSRSTKLVHGGVRYLAQGDISLVIEALHERGLLYHNAPHLVHDQSFVIPSYEWWGGPFYTIGLKVYDLMAGKLGLGPSVHISKEKTLEYLPNLKEDGLKGGVIYHDGQFDDSRLAINLAQTFVENGGTALNYFEVVELNKNMDNLVSGLKALDKISGKEFDIKAKVVVNATGVFADSILQMDDPSSPKTIRPSQGIHLVLDKKFLRGDKAIMIPKTSDGRVLFAVPWHDKVVVGTTDTPLDDIDLEPRALESEINFVLETASNYLASVPSREDVLSVFAGLRPLAAPQKGDESTKEISRKHKITVSLSGLVSILGGKWTIYRKMAEDTVDKAAMIAGLEDKACITKDLPIHGWAKGHDKTDPLSKYGSDKEYINELMIKEPDLKDFIHERLPYTKAEIVWMVRNEMPVTLEDVMSRRTRALLLDARASIEAAPVVAEIMAKELGHDNSWKKEQVNIYKELAEGYYLK
ncbi:glycerol-3-phosphate dehydrogenase/oxidase [Aureibacter tunicatorum]|uniref:Glycerol-3-phosphate dehydrogenase n=1 Tax=Aureibacter tunicatorum TaxID=866807 RepID=A0AAE3XSH9_9BACT|nr:glycerol-3-phosphate dehydrogenase/oxidase [Aureibacter tunicatorum]MDR6241214.1 glycerol-3-phosphate dehydrogenase [Aureibacter tunicatorum]BDD03475.1 glycerol-3-phosphate dehydrogenase [Aureibacter tunicatorum]